MKASDRKKIHAYLDSQRQQITDDLAAQIRIPSVKEAAGDNAPFGQPCVDALEDFLARARRMGFAVKNVDNYVGCVDLGDQEDSFGMLVHLDVVPAGAGWVHDPFGAQIEDDVMYGRGTLDDKGPAISALYAMAAVREAGIPLNCRIRLLLGTDEESGSEDIAYFKSKEALPRRAFSPDGEYPLVNVEKGVLRLALSAQYDAPSQGGRLLSISGGSRVNVVPGEMRATVAGVDPTYLQGVAAANTLSTGVRYEWEQKGEQIEITAYGHSAHASRPETGVNAACGLLALLAALPLGDGPGTDSLRALAAAFPLEGYFGQKAGIAVEDEVSGKLTVNLGLLEADAHSFKASLDIRYPITVNHDMLALRVADCTGLAVETLSHNPPHYVSEKSELVQALLRAYEDETGLEGRCLAIGGATYAREIPGSVAFGCLFPGDPDTMHQPEECVPLDKVLLNAKVLAAAIVENCALETD